MTAIFDIDPHFCNLSGQGYDNGVNMKVQVKGIHVPTLRINSRDFVTPCVCHKLNLALRDAMKCDSTIISFFGTIQ
jgi:hypothetical protein